MKPTQHDGDKHRPDMPRRLLETEGPAADALKQFKSAPSDMDEERAWRRTWAQLGAAKQTEKRPFVMNIGFTLSLCLATGFLMFIAGRKSVTLKVATTTNVAKNTSTKLLVQRTQDNEVDPQPPLSPAPQAKAADRKLLQGVQNISENVSVDVQNGSDVFLAANDPSEGLRLNKGQISASVSTEGDRGPFKVNVSPYFVTVMSARFSLSRTSSEVKLQVESGEVSLLRGDHFISKVKAHETWHSPLKQTTAAAALPADLAMVDPPEVVQDSLLALEKNAGTDSKPKASDPSCAPLAMVGVDLRLDCLTNMAKGNGIAAETAMYEIALLRRNQQSNPEEALRTLRNLRERFPKGALQTEVSITMVDILAHLRRFAAAMAESATFLANNPHNERRAELHLVRGNIMRETSNDCTKAIGEYDAATTAGRGEVLDEATFLKAVCQETLGRTNDATATYRTYLQRANVKHANEAQRRLQQLTNNPGK